MPTPCEWCGQPLEVDAWEALPREADDESETVVGLCAVCELQLDVTGTLWTYRDPTLAALVDDIQRRWPDPNGGA